VRKLTVVDLHDLKCPDCRRNLKGENNSCVFFCLSCSISFELVSEGLRKFPIFYIIPKIEKDLPIEYFPFWDIRTQYTISIPDKSITEPEEKHFYIPAFFIKNISNFGDVGFFYMQNGVSLKRGAPGKHPIFPADRSLKTSASYPYIYLLKEESQKNPGVKNIKIKMTHKTASIVLVPFYKTDQKYYDSFLFWEYPTGALI
jgi:hypothetical protein